MYLKMRYMFYMYLKYLKRGTCEVQKYDRAEMKYSDMYNKYNGDPWQPLPASGSLQYSKSFIIILGAFQKGITCLGFVDFEI